MYYRVACSVGWTQSWKWVSSPLAQVNSLIQWLLRYQALPRDRLLVFSASSAADLDDQLLLENQGQSSTATPAIQFVPASRQSLPEASQEATATPKVRGKRRGPGSNGADDPARSRSRPRKKPAARSHKQDTTPRTAGGERLVGRFTPDEAAKLVAVRRHFQAHPDYPDADAAVRRLEFARWLVQHGWLNEGFEPDRTDAQEPAA